VTRRHVVHPFHPYTHTQCWCVYYESWFSSLGLSACLVKEIIRHALCLARYYYPVLVYLRTTIRKVNAFCCYCHKTYAACRNDSEGQISQVCNDDDLQVQFQLNHDLLRRRVVQWIVIHNILLISSICCRKDLKQRLPRHCSIGAHEVSITFRFRHILQRTSSSNYTDKGMGKSKDKVHPRTGHEDPEGE